MLTHSLRAPFISPNSRAHAVNSCDSARLKSEQRDRCAVNADSRPKSQTSIALETESDHPTNTTGGTRYPPSNQEAVEQIAVGEGCSLLSLRGSTPLQLVITRSLVPDVYLALDEASSAVHVGVTRTFQGSTRMVLLVWPTTSSVRGLVDSLRSAQRGSSVDSSSNA